MLRRGSPWLLGAAAVLLSSFVILNRPSHADGPPGQMQFQARLTDGTGKPLPDGTVAKVTFVMFKEAAAVTSLWAEIHTNVAISRGVISVQLGNGDQTVALDGTATAGPNPLSPSLFDGTTRYLQITVNSDPPLSPTIPLVSVPYALSAGSINGKPESQVTPPVGTVIDWVPPTAGAAPPAGWVPCDGRTINDNTAPVWNGKRIPDLRSAFTRGLDPAAPAGQQVSAGVYPDAGGSSSVNLSHAHGVAAHSHSINTDGSHKHTGFTGAAIDDTTFNNVQGGNLYNTSSHHHDLSTMDPAGGHNHGGQTGSAGSSTDFQLGNVTTLPPYVGVIKIIRIK
jgi:hypothetical protein